jgi:lysozyme
MFAMQDLKDWIKKCEDLKLESYVDTTGHLTIGWGRNLENGISVDEAQLMFDNDFNRVLRELEEQDWYTMQPEGVQQALINMNFNLGIAKLLGFKKMIAALRNKDYTKASIEALDSRWAKQVHARATDIAVMISEGK